MSSTGELLDIERGTSSSEGGRWKSTYRGNSLAAYPTARTVTTGGMEKHSSAVRSVPTHCGRGGTAVGCNAVIQAEVGGGSAPAAEHGAFDFR